MKKPHRAQDPAAVKQAEEDAKLRRQQELVDVEKLLKTSEGLRFFRRIFTDGHVFSTTFAGNAPITYFKEGERNLALKYFNDVCEAAPEAIYGMITREDQNE